MRNLRNLFGALMLLALTGCGVADNALEEILNGAGTSSSEPSNEVVTCTITASDILFAAGDKLYVSGTGISGVLDIESGAGTASATFSGSLTYTGDGSPADDLALTATLVNAQQTVGTEVSVDADGIVTVNYPTTAYCANMTEANKYSYLTGTSTYGEKSFSLSQQTAFLNFVITFDDGTVNGTTLSAVVSNNGSAICTGNVTTITESTNVVAKFVLPLASGTTLSNANVKLGSKQAIAIDDGTLTGNVVNLNKTQDPYDLSATESANCYLVPAKGKYKFNATVKGNGSADLSGISKTTDANTIKSAVLIWATFNTTVAPVADELIKDISYDDGYVYFSTGDTYKEGNALVAIKDAENNILWSWHLWFESDDLEELAQTDPVSGYVFMDRNLGALTNCYNADDALDFGFTYQRGRKDPFMTSATRTSYTALGVLGTYTSASESSGVENSIKNPTVVFGTNSWGGDGSLWSATAKTIFDPCPPGWHIAGADAWNGFNATNFVIYNNDWGTYHGRMYNGEGWYPGTGDRWGSDHNNTGGRLDIWGVRELYSTSNEILTNAGSNPGHGFSIRAVKE